jgi:hypothetical protein
MSAPLPRAVRYARATFVPPPPETGESPMLDPTLPAPTPRCAVWLGHDDDEGGSHRCALPAGHLGSHNARVSS